MQNQPSSRIHLLKAVSMHGRSFHEEVIQTGIQQWHPESESTLGLQQTVYLQKKNACGGRHHEKASLKHDQEEVSRIKESR